MDKFFSSGFVKQFVYYFCVGGTAALVEWSLFYLFCCVFSVMYLSAVALAFLISTLVNWILGKNWAFKTSTKYKKHAVLELGLIFGVSIIGLVFNLLLMYFFVEICGLKTDLLMTLAKIATTGIVFLWNFLIRRYGIYKDAR